MTKEPFEADSACTQYLRYLREITKASCRDNRFNGEGGAGCLPISAEEVALKHNCHQERLLRERARGGNTNQPGQPR